MLLAKPFNLHNWVAENKHLLKPPVGNQVIYTGNEDFMVMVVGGPNARTDYHSNAGEELFYQLEGTITVGLIDPETGIKSTATLGPGDMMLVPGRMPHAPHRPEGSVGLVIERYRKDAAVEEDGFMWYCSNCDKQLYATYAHITDIVTQLPPILNAFKNNPSLHTCPKCGTVNN